MNTQKLDLGPVRSVYKGKYSTEANYELLNMVEHEGSSYVVIKSPYVKGKVPGVDNEYWGLTAKKGDKGEKGENGRDGVDGGTYNPAEPTKPGGVKPKPDGGINIEQGGSISIKPATPTVIGGVTYDNTTIKVKGNKSTLYTPLLTTISPDNNVNAVTSKAITNYAAGKDVNNVFTGYNTFQHRELKIKNPALDIFNPPASDNPPSINSFRFFDKRNIIIGELVYLNSSDGRRHIQLTNTYKKHINPETGENTQGKYLAARMGLTVDSNDVPYGTAPTTKAEHIGDYIATTKWVKDNIPVLSGAVPKKLGERTTNGDWTLSKLIIGKPLKIYATFENKERNNNIGISTKQGADVGKGTFFLGDFVAVGAFSYQSTNIFEIIPTSTTVILSIGINGQGKAVAYQ